MNKKINIDKKIIIILIVVILLVVGIGGYVYLSKTKKPKEGVESLVKTGKETEKIVENAIKGALPSIDTNPLENKPDINPADKANPYKNIKTNPFE